jgi:uncharacterized protein HemY
MNRAEFHKNLPELEKFLDQAIRSCPNTADVLTLSGDIMTRYERWRDAFKYFERALQRKPNNPTILMALSNCVRQDALREKDPARRASLFEKSLSLITKVRKTSIELSNQATSWAFHDMAQIPMEGE